MKPEVHPFTSLLNAVSFCALLICMLALLFPMQPAAVSTQPSAEVPRASQQLFSFSPEQLDTIRIVQGQDSFCLVNHGSSFVMEGMESVPLCLNKIDLLLDLLEAFPAGPSAEGKTEPFRRIELSFTSAASQTLFLYKEENQILLRWQNRCCLFSPEEIEALLWSAEDFADPQILPELQIDHGSLRLNGVLHEEPLELSFYMEDSFSAQMTSPHFIELDGETAASLIQSLSGLRAEEVVVLNPSGNDLDFFGLSQPFCTLEGQISTVFFHLSASSVQPDGTVYLLSSQHPLIYAVDIEQLPLLSVCSETLLDDSLFTPDYEDTTTVTFSFPQEQYLFTKWAGQVLCKGKQIDEPDFYDLFRLSTSLIPREAALLPVQNTDPLMTLSFSYTNPEKDKDWIVFYPYKEELVLLSVNGSADFLIDAALIEEIRNYCTELLG